MQARSIPSSLPWITLALSGLVLLLAPFEGLLTALEYQRSAIADGQFYRLLTAQLTHCSAEHLFWDLLMFAVLGVACERADRRAYWICLGASLILIPLGVWFLQPGMLSDRGLSGIDSALFVLFALGLLRQFRRAGKSAWAVATQLALLAFSAKLAYEYLTGQALFVATSPGTQLVPLAHLLGSLAGIAAHARTCAPRRICRFRAQETTGAR